MDLPHILQARYTTKAYDATRRIPQDKVTQLMAALRFSPSSVNAQPWHFILADDEAGKQRLAKATPVESPLAYNREKIIDASHVVLLCAKNELTDSYLHSVLEQEEKDGRYQDAAARDGFAAARAGYVQQHKTAGDVAHWNQKQVYLAQGFLLLSAAMLGIDATPIEGFEPEVLSHEFGLKEKGLTPLVIVSLGYHAERDNNAKRPKSRLGEDVLFSKA
ncbi:oxygen-insensitive NAD(P)H nitroreductase [Bombella sp. ESL0378]|uniref:oxygen-insensitive NAD(P)H nitroreductase n=1 Tax=Bombella sp. ESL0378 TaxID=2676442 RepID=UPI0012D85CC6|nr:oxygen-insensitive NAD(P)H nitroreductase [Bombella sp. ESL0378]MUG04634.1 oxygen-insensitive NAD(P)H nitroreductase [Bombella sp. ESL0378]